MTTHNSNKRVLFTSHTANFSKFNRPLMRWFKQQGWDVHYASMGEEFVEDCDKHFRISFTRNPLTIDNIRAIKQIKKVIDEYQYDIIHTHTPSGGVVTRIAARNSRKNGTRIIYTAHGFHFFKGAPFFNWLIYYPIEKIMARYTDTLITINNEDYQRATKSFSTDVVYVPGVGVDFKKFSAPISEKTKSALLHSLKIPRHAHIIIYVAELSKRKNQEEMLDDWSRIKHRTKETHLLLAGIDSLNGKIQKKANRLGLNEYVHILGYRNDIPTLLQLAHEYISYSRQEGLAVNIIEAKVAGLPIKAKSARGVDDILYETDIGKYEQARIIKAMAKIYTKGSE
jgi:glycosyltransferase EpsD